MAFADAVLIAVPYAALPSIAKEVGAELKGKVVVDPNNPVPKRDGEMAVAAKEKGAAVMCELCNLELASTAGQAADEQGREALAAIGSALRFQPFFSQPSLVGGEHTDQLCPTLLRVEDMLDDLVPITPSPARTLLHLSRHALAHLVKKYPAGLHQRQLTFQLLTRQVLLVDARKRERDTPEVG